jgi:hypothetical protein
VPRGLALAALFLSLASAGCGAPCVAGPLGTCLPDDRSSPGSPGVVKPAPPPENCPRSGIFPNARVTGTRDGELARIVIEWDQGSGFAAKLEDSYFELAAPSTALEAAFRDRMTSVKFESPRRLVVDVDLAGLSFPTRFPIALDFPDLRNFAGCKHPGMDDVHHLQVELHFDENGLFLQAVLEESVSLGDL